MGDDGLLTQEEMEKIGLEADQVELILINHEIKFYVFPQIKKIRCVLVFSVLNQNPLGPVGRFFNHHFLVDMP